MDGEVRSIYLLTQADIRQMARNRHDAGATIHDHGFKPGSSQAISYELAFRERQRELESLEAST